MNSSPYLIYHDFLDLSVNRQLYSKTLSKEGSFDNTTIFKQNVGKVVNTGWRKSKLLAPQHFVEFRHKLIANINMISPVVFNQLLMDSFPLNDIEMALTCHNHNDFYKPHIDGGKGKFESRIITFVYYFHSIPKKFYGGELIIQLKDGETKVVEPENNMIIFFDSTLLHAVGPVNCPSMNFADSRFTLNGWLHKKKSI